jgi:hypothetical protein
VERGPKALPSNLTTAAASSAEVIRASSPPAWAQKRWASSADSARSPYIQAAGLLRGMTRRTVLPSLAIPSNREASLVEEAPVGEGTAAVGKDRQWGGVRVKQEVRPQH